MTKKTGGSVSDMRVTPSSGDVYVSVSHDIGSQYSSNSSVIKPVSSTTTADPTSTTIILATGVNDIAIVDSKLIVAYNDGTKKEFTGFGGGSGAFDGVKELTKVDDKILVRYTDGTVKEIGIGKAGQVNDLSLASDKLIVSYANGTTKEIKVAATNGVKNLSSSAGKLTVSYADGTSKDVNIAPIEGVKNITSSTGKLTISYVDGTSKDVTVATDGVKNITSSAGKLTISYVDGTSKDVSVAPVDVVKDITSSAGKLTVGYADGTSKDVTVAPVDVVKEITSSTGKLTVGYADGTTKDIKVAPTDGVKNVTATDAKLVIAFDDGTSKDIPTFVPAPATMIPTEATDLETLIALVNSMRQVILANNLATSTAPIVTLNLTLPTISGTPKVGETLTSTLGTWQGQSLTYARQWKANGATITGATNTTYVPVLNDVGKTITVTVTASNIQGPVSAVSAATSAIITNIVPVPVNTVLPIISGKTEDGETVSVTTGTWTNSPTSFTYQWRANNLPITGATSSTYVITSAEAGKTLSVVVKAVNSVGEGTVVTDPVGPVGSVPQNGLDLTMPVPTMSIYGGIGVFPPTFDIIIPVEAQADNIKFKIERYALSSINTVAQTYSGTITDAMVNANAITGLLSDISVPCLYRMRLETLDGSSWGGWSNSVVHGDVDGPAISTASAISLKEGVKLSLPLTVTNEPAGVTWAISGIDANLFELVGSTVRIEGDGVFDYETPVDGNKNNVYELILIATDLAGNVGTKNVSVTITDADEIVDAFSFTKQANAAVNTDYSRTMTVSGLEAGYSVPISASGGLRYSINGGTITTTDGLVKNGDTVAVTMKSSENEATTISGTLNIGGVTGSFSVQTVIGTTPAISSASFFPATYMQYTKEISLDFGVGVGFFLVSTSDKATNFKVDGVSVTSLISPVGTFCYLLMFESTVAGTKKLTYDLTDFANASAMGVTVANVQMSNPTVAVTPNNYYNVPLVINAPVIPTDGVGVVMLFSGRRLNSTTYQNNLNVEQIFTGPKVDDGDMMVATLAEPGNAAFGSENGIYVGATVGLSKKI